MSATRLIPLAAPHEVYVALRDPSRIDGYRLGTDNREIALAIFEPVNTAHYVLVYYVLGGHVVTHRSQVHVYNRATNELKPAFTEATEVAECPNTN